MLSVQVTLPSKHGPTQKFSRLQQLRQLCGGRTDVGPDLPDRQSL